jgi:putative oxidoreductase
MISIINRHANGILFTMRLILGCVFLASSLPKIRQPLDFLGDVYKYQLTGPGFSKFIVMTLPWLEFFLAIGVIGGLFLGGCFIGSAALTLTFAVAQASAIARGLEITCGCFGGFASGDIIGYVSLLRVGLMFVAAVAGMIAWRAALADESAARSYPAGDHIDGRDDLHDLMPAPPGAA